MLSSIGNLTNWENSINRTAQRNRIAILNARLIDFSFFSTFILYLFMRRRRTRFGSIYLYLFNICPPINRKICIHWSDFSTHKIFSELTLWCAAAPPVVNRMLSSAVGFRFDLIIILNRCEQKAMVAALNRHKCAATDDDDACISKSVMRDNQTANARDRNVHIIIIGRKSCVYLYETNK